MHKTSRDALFHHHDDNHAPNFAASLVGRDGRTMRDSKSRSPIPFSGTVSFTRTGLVGVGES